MGLARRDRAAAREQLRALVPDQLAELCQELRASLRSEFLMLLDHPEDVVPLLPEAEPAATIVAGGVFEGAWLLEVASPDQRVACIDLDCWRGYSLALPQLRDWIDALIEAGRPTLLRTLEELDPELWVLLMRDMADVTVIGKEEEPPDGWFTEDGVCYFGARSDEDYARVREIAQTAFSEAQPRYWQLVYGMLFESPSEIEEYALRWRSARMADLGFPEREQAMQAYRPLSSEAAPVWNVTHAEPGALVPYESLPQQLRGTLVGRALAELPADRAADVLGYVLAVANSLAVADYLALSDAESIPGAMAKAIADIDRGLAELAQVRGEEPHRILDQTKPMDLFRVGATLQGLTPEPNPDADLEEEEEGDETEWI